MKTALITGVCGQDGAYLSRHLLNNDYRVIGLARRNSPRANLEFLNIEKHVVIVDCDITDPFQVSDEIYRHKPQEIYNLAAQSHVGQSFKNPMATCAVNYGGFLNVLLSARKFLPDAKIYQAGTSEMFGYAAEGIANEQTPFAPMSPYAISKVASHWAGVNSRYEANQFVSNGILFNHESPLRGNDFVTRKITKYVADYKNGNREPLVLGNVDSIRDWGHACDYVKAMHLMLQQDFPNDFVIATGEAYSVRKFLQLAFQSIDKVITFDGSGLKERGYIDGKCVMVIADYFYRPNELKHLRGNSRRAQQLLKWKPEIPLAQTIDEMIARDIK